MLIRSWFGSRQPVEGTSLRVSDCQHENAFVVAFECESVGEPLQDESANAGGTVGETRPMSERLGRLCDSIEC
jgi:hypothetical protein